MIGYLDIETSFRREVTVVGVLRPDRGLLQLVGESVCAASVSDALEGLDCLCTFHGDGFDIPVLQRAFGMRIFERFRSLDLSPECRRAGMSGGLKHIEERLAIPRSLRGIGGYDAMVLWERWERGDAEALETLLAYNADDVINLALLERRLRGDLEALPDPVRTVVGASTPARRR